MLRYLSIMDIKSVPRCEQFSEREVRQNCELWGTDNVQGQVSKHILRLLCLIIILDLQKMQDLKIGEYHPDIPQF